MDTENIVDTEHTVDTANIVDSPQAALETRNQDNHRKERDTLECIERLYNVIEESEVTQAVIAGKGKDG